MKSNFNDKLGMYHKVQAYIRQTAAQTAGSPAIATGLTELEAVIAEIVATLGQASLDLTGYAENKVMLKKELVNLVSGVSNVYMSVIIQSRTNLVKFKKSIGTLAAMRDNDLYIYALQLSAAARPLIADFAPYGVHADKLDRLDSICQQFLNAKETPKLKVEDRKASNEKLPLLFEKADRILTLKLDASMEQFRTSNFMLFTGYRNARSIDQTGSRSTPDFEGEVPPNAVIKVEEIIYDGSRDFKIKNNGDVTFYVSLSSDPENMEGHIAIVEPGATILRKSSTLNELPANFLLVQNRDAHFTASYRISIE